MTKIVSQKELGKNSYNKEELIKCGQGELFGEGNCQLPIDNMLMLDRIITITADGGEHGKGELVAELDIDKGIMVFPMSLPK